MNFVVCPRCLSRNTLQESFIGFLGSIGHLRCRYCGHTWGLQLDPRELETENDDDEQLD